VDPDSVFKRRGFAGSAEEENTAARWTPAFPTDQVRGLKAWGTHSANDMAQELKGAMSGLVVFAVGCGAISAK
jgi:hypothetical protein